MNKNIPPKFDQSVDSFFESIESFTRYIEQRMKDIERQYLSLGGEKLRPGHDEAWKNLKGGETDFVNRLTEFSIYANPVVPVSGPKLVTIQLTIQGTEEEINAALERIQVADWNAGYQVLSEE